MKCWSEEEEEEKKSLYNKIVKQFMKINKFIETNHLREREREKESERV